MPSDIEMGDSDSSILDTEITLDPEIIANIKPAPERVVHRCKEYHRHPGVRAAEAPSVIWRVRQEYERNRKKESIIEASECLKNWWIQGLIEQQPYTPQDDDSDDCELEDEDNSDL